MKNLRSVLLALLVALPSACAASSSAADIPCTCGSLAADMEGCAHRMCLDGETNPDNPDCLCGGLSFPK